MEAAPLAQLPRYPAIGGVALIALGIFGLASPEMLDPLRLDLRAFWSEPWRLLTSALVHGGQLDSERWLQGLVHVGFNCYWLWLLGTGVEQRLGHLRTLALLALFGVGGGALEYGFNWSSVGLSGVVYGLVGMLWVLARRSPSWAGMIDSRTVKFFVGWFVFCVVATVLEVMPIANFAHAGGAALGVLVGWGIAARGVKRAAPIGLTIATLGLCLASATVLRPWVNISAYAGLDAMVQAERAEADDDLEAAIAWAERGVGYWRTPADHWAYLGRLYYEARRYADARDALREAVARDPDHELYGPALEQAESLAHSF
ncbi:Rhomboid protease GlpG [Enhygromyxa salina]|uniref:Rhomboid protease GlpG n=1 Tax=Enhygromyxa salina TaxID=215803 RepID=A0A2S9XBQ0_9BACT|nr:rhomboid family intramembrane serine protease [Enhygromyxa salina]PRP90230.1 Rhomboid protease GlpG [Enhygromyxa salina]